jgi:tetratricopeptide (TPR) repeat protein
MKQEKSLVEKYLMQIKTILLGASHNKQKRTFAEYIAQAKRAAENGNWEEGEKNLWDADGNFPNNFILTTDSWIELARLAIAKDQPDRAEKYLNIARRLRERNPPVVFDPATRQHLGNGWKDLAIYYGEKKCYAKCLESVGRALEFGATKDSVANSVMTFALNAALSKQFQDAWNLLAKLQSLINEQAIETYLKVVWLASKAGQIEFGSRILYDLVDNTLPRFREESGMDSYYINCPLHILLSIAGEITDTTERERAHDLGIDEWPNLISVEKSSSGFVGLAWDAVREGNYEQAVSNMGHFIETLDRIRKDDENIERIVAERKKLYRKYYFDFARYAKGTENSFEYWLSGYINGHRVKTLDEQIEAYEIAKELGFADLAGVEEEQLQRLKELAEWKRQRKFDE